MDFVYANAPQRIYWEITRACDLACRHCRAEAQPQPLPGELTTAEAFKLIDQIAASPEKPHLILTGGDPFKRADLLDLVRRAVAAGLHVSVSPSATPLLTKDRVVELEQAGVEAMSLSLDGSDAERHDGLRGVPGTFARTLEAARHILDAGILLQVNTLVTSATMSDLSAIDALVTELGAQRWSLFFLITVGRGRELGQITPDECEQLFTWVHRRSKLPGPVITTTEAPHYRRVVMQLSQLHRKDQPAAPAGRPKHTGAGIRDGNGVMFIGHDGEITPSGFLPLHVAKCCRSPFLVIPRSLHLG
jgi:MoaA/NifB/PqqE/SkfB family radical SAM enzyme